MSLPEKFASLQDPTIEQTIEILQSSEATIFRLCKKGILQKYKFGNSSRITLDSIKALRNNAA